MQPQTKQRLRKQNGAIAQLVEQRTENPCVPGSIPGGTTTKCSVRITVSTQDSQSCNRGSIPLPSTKFYKNFGRIPEWPNGADCKSAGFYLRWFESIFSHINFYAEVAQLVEHNLAKVGVASSSLVFRSKRVSRNADLLFEKYHPTGFNHMSVVLVHKAAFLFLYTLILAKYLLLQSIWIEQR